MPTQPDRQRLTTMCEQQPTPQAQTQHRWSAPVQPTASLVQPGYTDLGAQPPRPLRAPAHPLSSRALLDQQTCSTTPSNHVSSQQTSQQTFPHQTPARQGTPGRDSPEEPITPQRTSQLRPRLRARLRQLFRPSRRETTTQTTETSHPIVSPPRPPISSPKFIPTQETPVDQFETPRSAPLPPTLSPPSTTPRTPPSSSSSSSEQTLVNSSHTSAPASAPAANR